MRELLLKNLVSRDKKRTELFLLEHYEHNGIVQQIEKRTIYKIKEILEFTDFADLELFLKQKAKEDSSIRRFIIKSHISRNHTDKLIYKVIANQYVVLSGKIFVLKVSQYLKKMMSGRNENPVAQGL